MTTIETFIFNLIKKIYNSMVSCQKGPSHHAYAWQIEPFWQDTIELWTYWALLPLDGGHFVIKQQGN